MTGVLKRSCATVFGAIMGLNLLLLLSASPSHAAFYEKQDLPTKPAQVDRVFEASVRIGNSAIGKSSAVILSKEGYVVTAFHSLSKCYESTWSFKPPMHIERSESEDPSYGFVRVADSDRTRVECPENFLGRLTIFEFQWQHPKVVWVGKGYFTASDKTLAGLNDEVFAELVRSSEDVAILKYDRTYEKKDKTVECLRLSEVDPHPGDPLWSVGFPRSVKRDDGFGSNGAKEYASPGITRRSISEDPFLKDLALTQADPGLFWEREMILWDRPEVLLSSVDASGGNSGGAIVDADGNLAAVLFGVTKESQAQFDRPTVFGFKAQALKAAVVRDLGEAQAREIFACD